MMNDGSLAPVDSRFERYFKCKDSKWLYTQYSSGVQWLECIKQCACKNNKLSQQWQWYQWLRFRESYLCWLLNWKISSFVQSSTDVLLWLPEAMFVIFFANRMLSALWVFSQNLSVATRPVRLHQMETLLLLLSHERLQFHPHHAPAVVSSVIKFIFLSHLKIKS